MFTSYAIANWLVFQLTLTLLAWRIWWARNHASRWQIGFHSAFKELIQLVASPNIPVCEANPQRMWLLFFDFSQLIGSSNQEQLNFHCVNKKCVDITSEIFKQACSPPWGFSCLLWSSQSSLSFLHLFLPTFSFLHIFPSHDFATLFFLSNCFLITLLSYPQCSPITEKNTKQN